MGAQTVRVCGVRGLVTFCDPCMDWEPFGEVDGRWGCLTCCTILKTVATYRGSQKVDPVRITDVRVEGDVIVLRKTPGVGFTELAAPQVKSAPEGVPTREGSPCLNCQSTEVHRRPWSDGSGQVSFHCGRCDRWLRNPDTVFDTNEMSDEDDLTDDEVRDLLERDDEGRPYNSVPDLDSFEQIQARLRAEKDESAYEALDRNLGEEG